MLVRLPRGNCYIRLDGYFIRLVSNITNIVTLASLPEVKVY